MVNDNILKKLLLQFCHDMAGPLNTINNIVELELDPTDQIDNQGDKIQELLKKSSSKATILLQIYRDILFTSNKYVQIEKFSKLIIEYAEIYNIQLKIEQTSNLKEINHTMASCVALSIMKICKTNKNVKCTIQITICLTDCIISKPQEQDINFENIIESIYEYFKTLSGINIDVVSGKIRFATIKMLD